MPATIIEKNINPQLTAKTPTPPPPTPLAAANHKIVEAKAASREEGERRRKAWLDHRNSRSYVPFNFSPALAATAEMEHVNQGNRLRSASQNYSPQTFLSSLLDVDENKVALEDALRHLKAKHADILKHKASVPATVAPKKNGLVTAIEGLLGSPVEPEPAWPPPREPVRGIWGQDEPLDIGKELSRISDFVVSFPLTKSFEEIVMMMNAVGSAIVALNPESKPAQAVRQDKGWRVPAHM